MVGNPEAETRIKSFPHQFSGGMRQRVMIAMALALSRSYDRRRPTTALELYHPGPGPRAAAPTSPSRAARRSSDHPRPRGRRGDDQPDQRHVRRGTSSRSATTSELFANPSHPYTVGLLHSIPRLDAIEGAPLVPIEGRPPDMRPCRPPVVRPAAAWRLETCCRRTRARPLVDGTRPGMTGPEATTGRLLQPPDAR